MYREFGKVNQTAAEMKIKPDSAWNRWNLLNTIWTERDGSRNYHCISVTMKKLLYTRSCMFALQRSTEGAYMMRSP